MEKDLYENLKVLPKRIKNDKDCLFLVVGSPGEGKSTLAQQVCYFLDPSFNIDRIKYSFEDYVKFSLKLFDSDNSKGKAIIHDEAKEVLSAVSVMSKRTRMFMNYLYENRQTNMYQCILTGDFFDIPKSIAMQRVLFVIWVHEQNEFQNGFFKFYNRSDLKRLYIYGKKDRNMLASKRTFRGTFPKFYTVNEIEYRKLKKQHLEASRYLDDKNKKDIDIRTILRWILQRNPNINPTDCINVVDCVPNYFFTIRKELRDNG